MKNLKFWTEKIICPNLQATIKFPFEFFMWPGCIGGHHSWEGGLFDHTIEVLEYCERFSRSIRCNTDILYTAALWHDYGKIWDYEKQRVFEGQEIPQNSLIISHKNYKDVYFRASYIGRIHHITGSTAEFTASAIINGVDRSIIQEIQHCIISHHGRKEWGSIKEPQSPEAIILHMADTASAHFGKPIDL